ncbi:MAG: 6,7-dimethyl-8-ribityllumazine synthase, partial [uncultured Acetobacteraceae bacterium]
EHHRRGFAGDARRPGGAAAPAGHPGAVLRAGGGRHARRSRARVRRRGRERRRRGRGRRLRAAGGAPHGVAVADRFALRRLPRPRLRGARRDRPLSVHLRCGLPGRDGRGDRDRRRHRLRPADGRYPAAGGGPLGREPDEQGRRSGAGLARPSGAPPTLEFGV